MKLNLSQGKNAKFYETHEIPLEVMVDSNEFSRYIAESICRFLNKYDKEQNVLFSIVDEKNQSIEHYRYYPLTEEIVNVMDFCFIEEIKEQIQITKEYNKLVLHKV